MIRERTCIASSETLPESALVRFAAGPDGVVTPDVASKLPGRGVWVRADRALIDKAVKRNLFSRGLKNVVAVEPCVFGVAPVIGLAQCNHAPNLCGELGKANSR